MINYLYKATKRDKSYFHNYPAYTENLSVIDTICEHNGCVNTVDWDNSGTRILSGGDDLYLRIHQYMSNGHTSWRNDCVYQKSLLKSRNIFSAKFMPADNEKIVSGSKCGSIFLVDINDIRPQTIPYYKHVGPVLNIVTARDVTTSPHEFVSLSTDKTACIFDNRAAAPILTMRFPCGLSSADFHPVQQHLLAIGGGDSFVRVFDRRSLANTDVAETIASTMELCRPLEFEDCCRLSPDCRGSGPGNDNSNSSGLGGLGTYNRRYVNSVRYEPNFGRFLLVNYMYDNVYMYDTHRTEDCEFDGATSAGGLSDKSNYPPTHPTLDRSVSQDTGSIPESSPFHIHYNWANTGPPTEVEPERNVIVCPPSIQTLLSNLQRNQASSTRNVNAFESPESIALQLSSGKRYKQIGIYFGTQNFRTMIKDSVFWGTDYLLAGSECGHILVWHRKSPDPVCAVPIDSHVANRVCPHPSLPVIASCGIDKNIKIVGSNMQPIYGSRAEQVAKINKIVQINGERTRRAKTSHSISMMDLLRIMRAQRLSIIPHIPR